jgi:Kef-type K+ transport system membrane component KefB
MTGKNNDWVKHPRKKQVITVALVWFICTVLMFAASTNLFHQSPFQKQYFLLYLLCMSALSVVFRVIRNYRRLQHNR